MDRFRVLDDEAACRSVWEALSPGRRVTDRWGFRAAFHRAYGEELRFIVGEDENGPFGLLPLVRVREIGVHHVFPGERWHDKTWLERNHFFLRSPEHLPRLLAAVPRPAHLRYLAAVPGADASAHLELDEINYTFHPAACGYDVEQWAKSLPRDSRRGILRDVERLHARGVEFVIDRWPDFDWLVAANLERFGSESYLADPRFVGGFRQALEWMRAEGFARLVSVEIGGVLAAVDLLCIADGLGTAFLGAVSAEFPGVAKVINHHHLQFACDARLDELDFLCGDFGWKNIWRFTPTPQYQVFARGGAEAAQ